MEYYAFIKHVDYNKYLMIWQFSHLNWYMRGQRTKLSKQVCILRKPDEIK